MKRIDLDFRWPLAPGLLALRAALLIIGALALGTVLMQQQQVRNEAKSLAWQKQSLSRLGARSLPAMQAATGNAASLDEAKRANEVLRQLNLPWDRLFRALEKSVTPEVRVLSVAPDALKSSITIKATATDMDAAIDFMERLRATQLLMNVHLITHEATEEDDGNLWQFTLAANWEAMP